MNANYKHTIFMIKILPGAQKIQDVQIILINLAFLKVLKHPEAFHISPHHVVLRVSLSATMRLTLRTVFQSHLVL